MEQVIKSLEEKIVSIETRIEDEVKQYKTMLEDIKIRKDLLDQLVVNYKSIEQAINKLKE